MRSLWHHADEIPVTLVVVLAYVSLAFVTGLAEPDAERLAAYGWLTPLLAADGEPWRLLTHAFLHGGLVHLAFNGYMLLQVGPALERSLGSLRFLALYAAAAIGGGVAVCLLYPVEQPIVGGSGALFGLLGAAVAVLVRSGRHALEFLTFDGPRALLSLIAVNLLIGWILPFVSNTAHLGGLATGFVVTLLWLAPPRQPSPRFRQWRAATAALFAALLFASLFPVVRHDWLWNQGVRTADADRRERLQRAAVMAWSGRDHASEADVLRFYRLVVDPDAPRPR
ncbi:MAG: rhomboid family intramembrane serine protease [Planctomycetes bacterium]|nr:rhomboid family intramembrane serine protease [Planctomycetota bacterium]